MTHCYNCGHTGTFVLLAQFALPVPGPVADRPARPGHRGRPSPGDDSHHWDHPRDHRWSADWNQSCDPNRSRRGRDPDRGPRNRDVGASEHDRGPRNRDVGPSDSDVGPSDSDLGPADRDPVDARFGSHLLTEADLSFAVQCPACHSTDVGLTAAELLARYGSSTTS